MAPAPHTTTTATSSSRSGGGRIIPLAPGAGMTGTMSSSRWAGGMKETMSSMGDSNMMHVGVAVAERAGRATVTAASSSSSGVVGAMHPTTPTAATAAEAGAAAEGVASRMGRVMTATRDSSTTARAWKGHSGQRRRLVGAGQQAAEAGGAPSALQTGAGTAAGAGALGTRGPGATAAAAVTAGDAASRLSWSRLCCRLVEFGADSCW